MEECTRTNLNFQQSCLYHTYIQVIACVCGCHVCVRPCTQVEVCFDCFLVLCFVLGFVLQSGEMAHKRVHCYYYYCIRWCDIIPLSPQFRVTCIRPVLWINNSCIWAACRERDNLWHHHGMEPPPSLWPVRHLDYCECPVCGYDSQRLTTSKRRLDLILCQVFFWGWGVGVHVFHLLYLYN